MNLNWRPNVLHQRLCLVMTLISKLVFFFLAKSMHPVCIVGHTVTGFDDATPRPVLAFVVGTTLRPTPTPLLTTSLVTASSVLASPSSGILFSDHGDEALSVLLVSSPASLSVSTNKPRLPVSAFCAFCPPNNRFLRHRVCAFRVLAFLSSYSVNARLYIFVISHISVGDTTTCVVVRPFSDCWPFVRSAFVRAPVSPSAIESN